MNNEEKILQMLTSMQSDMTSMKSDMTSMQSDVTSMKSDMTSMKSDMTSMKSDITSLRTDVTSMKSDMTSMKSDMTSMKSDITSLRSDVTSIQLYIENHIDPALGALAEGQQTILETLAPKNRVEALEDEMLFMKQVVKALSGEIQELKKAQ